MSKPLQFRTTETTEIIDDKGSTKTVQEKYMHGVAQSPKKVKYRIPHPTDLTDIASLEAIAKKLVTDPTKLEKSLEFEHTKRGDKNGYYIIYECYTVLEY